MLNVTDEFRCYSEVHCLPERRRKSRGKSIEKTNTENNCHLNCIVKSEEDLHVTRYEKSTNKGNINVGSNGIIDNNKISDNSVSDIHKDANSKLINGKFPSHSLSVWQRVKHKSYYSFHRRAKQNRPHNPNQEHHHKHTGKKKEERDREKNSVKSNKNNAFVTSNTVHEQVDNSENIALAHDSDSNSKCNFINNINDNCIITHNSSNETSKHIDNSNCCNHKHENVREPTSIHTHRVSTAVRLKQLVQEKLHAMLRMSAHSRHKHHSCQEGNMSSEKGNHKEGLRKAKRNKSHRHVTSEHSKLPRTNSEINYNDSCKEYRLHVEERKELEEKEQQETIAINNDNNNNYNDNNNSNEQDEDEDDDSCSPWIESRVDVFSPFCCEYTLDMDDDFCSSTYVSDTLQRYITLIDMNWSDNTNKVEQTGNRNNNNIDDNDDEDNHEDDEWITCSNSSIYESIRAPSSTFIEEELTRSTCDRHLSVSLPVTNNDKQITSPTPAPLPTSSSSFPSEQTLLSTMKNENIEIKWDDPYARLLRQRCVIEKYILILTILTDCLHDCYNQERTAREQQTKWFTKTQVNVQTPINTESTLSTTNSSYYLEKTSNTALELPNDNQKEDIMTTEYTNVNNNKDNNSNDVDVSNIDASSNKVVKSKLLMRRRGAIGFRLRLRAQYNAYRSLIKQIATRMVTFWVHKVNLSRAFEDAFADATQLFDAIELEPAAEAVPIIDGVACNAILLERIYGCKELSKYSARMEFLSSHDKLRNAITQHIKELYKRLRNCWKQHVTLREEMKLFDNVDICTSRRLLRLAKVSVPLFRKLTKSITNATTQRDAEVVLEGRKISEEEKEEEEPLLEQQRQRQEQRNENNYLETDTDVQKDNAIEQENNLFNNSGSRKDSNSNDNNNNNNINASNNDLNDNKCNLSPITNTTPLPSFCTIATPVHSALRSANSARAASMERDVRRVTFVINEVEEEEKERKRSKEYRHVRKRESDEEDTLELISSELPHEDDLGIVDNLERMYAVEEYVQEVFERQRPRLLSMKVLHGNMESYLSYKEQEQEQQWLRQCEQEEPSHEKCLNEKCKSHIKSKSFVHKRHERKNLNKHHHDHQHKHISAA